MQPFTFFISYRRQDTAPIALLLKTEIERRLQFVRVSVDVEELKPGEDFPDRLKHFIDEAHATIALIGAKWMLPRGASLADPEQTDWVAREIEYSMNAPLRMAEADRFGRSERLLVPLFVDSSPNFEKFEIPSSIEQIAKLQSESISYSNWPTAIGPLLDRVAVKLELKKRPDKDEYPKPDLAKARTQPLDDAALASVLSYDDFEGWYVDNFGNAEVRYLAKTFKFPHFNQAADFMQLVSDHCRIQDHHPEWRNVFDHVTVSLTTWDARRRVTIYDISLALYMNMAAKAVLKS
jgi:pterin-4a-carbinolamine dehydratase